MSVMSAKSRMASTHRALKRTFESELRSTFGGRCPWHLSTNRDGRASRLKGEQCPPQKWPQCVFTAIAAVIGGNVSTCGPIFTGALPPIYTIASEVMEICSVD